MNWWKAHHGIATDRKYAVILRRVQQARKDRNALRGVIGSDSNECSVTRAVIVSIWVWLIDFASQNEPRGSISEVEIDEIAVSLDVPDELVSDVMDAFQWKGMISGNLLTAFEKRQPPLDKTNPERQKRHRQKVKQSNALRNDQNALPLAREEGDLDRESSTEENTSGSNTSLQDKQKNIHAAAEVKSSGSSGNGHVSGGGVPVSAYSYQRDSEFSQFAVPALKYWPDLIDEDLEQAFRFSWKKFDFEQKKMAIDRLVERISVGEDPRFVKRLPKYLENGDWKRPPRAKDSPKSNGDYKYKPPADIVNDEKFQQLKREREERKSQ